ncbi:MAG: TIGR02757 family protein [Desulfobacteraceae bacterium]|nr:TIGR02757 family protein [Desulfobacteraceae bacterium]
MNLKKPLDKLYEEFNTGMHVHTDPIIFLYDYNYLKDREIVGLITACLAYGRVAQIKKSVAAVLNPMGASPHDFLLQASLKDLSETFSGFVHRFARADHLSGLLWGIRQVVREYGSLQECMTKGPHQDSATILPGLNAFVQEILSVASSDPGHLLPLPHRGSASKRLHLFLRWMVRKDDVDPGGWENIHPSRLIVPVDVHMHRICTLMKFTERKQANLKTAMEITCCFKKISPHDPVKYDFALTRIGIEQLPVPGFIKT